MFDGQRDMSLVRARAKVDVSFLKDEKKAQVKRMGI
jgi:hypothetical protein